MKLALDYKIIDKPKIAKPFLKWAGGKTQLLGQFDGFFPEELKENKIEKYFEPFIGSGAVFFHILQDYSIKKSFINDSNEELIHVYQVIKNDVNNLIETLKKIKEHYFNLSESKRPDYYYQVRKDYNKNKSNNKIYSKTWILKAAQLIFLNKTCFNGLFRINNKGEFNVPFGKYRNPKILDKENLIAVSLLLQNVIIEAKDFTVIRNKVDKDSFVYFDPPYRPISPTSNFTSYTKDNFSERDQLRLAKLFKELDKTGAKLMLSNSDPNNGNHNGNFFETIYKGFNIYRVNAKRMINCDASKRGHIKELVITNY